MMSQAQLDGDPMPDNDILDIMVTLTLGSLDTLKSQLGWRMCHLATHPDDRDRLVADPALIPTPSRSSCGPTRSSGWPAR